MKPTVRVGMRAHTPPLHPCNIYTKETLHMQNKSFQILSSICFVGGAVSILGSIAIWFFLRTEDPAYAQRFGIFVGLWAPTFFILSGRFATQTVVENLPANG